jgi:alkylation response protein AidB-like acyl-CoA dehydrogenase
MTPAAAQPLHGPGLTGAQPAGVLDRAGQLHQLLDQCGAGHDRDGRLAPEVVDALHEHGMFGLWVPTELGGRELDPVTSLQVIADLAYADPSTAWVVMAGCLATGAAGAYLADSAVATLFGGPRMPVIAGQGTRPGHAAPVDGGYLLTGSWSFGSGLLHADHVHTLGAVEGTGENRIFIVPVEKAELHGGSWDVLGLRGTGSIDYTIDGVFVPREYTYPNTITEPIRGGALYRLGIFQFALIGHSGWALGVARRLLDELAATMRAKIGRAGRTAGAGAFQSEFGRAEAEYHAARAFVLQAWGELCADVYAGRPLPARSQTLIRLALHNATWAAARIGEFVYRSAGTTALRAGTIQRFYRDLHAGTQHVTSGPGVLEECGRELAGLAGEAPQWGALALVDTGAV